MCTATEIRAEIQSSGFDSRKKIKIFHENQGSSCAFSGEKSGRLCGKISKILSEPWDLNSLKAISFKERFPGCVRNAFYVR